MIIVDDMVDTAATLQNLSKRLSTAGAKRIYLCAAHGLFSEHALDYIENSPVTKILVTDSLPLPTNLKTKKIEQVSISKYLADVIVTEHLQNTHPNKTVVEEKFEEFD